MLIRGFQHLSVFFHALILAVMLAGCGGGGGGSSSGTISVDSPVESNVVDIVARTGPIIAVRVGETPMLDGSRSFITSTENGFSSSADPLSFQWAFTHKPDSSTTTLQNASTSAPSFVADAEGVYMVQLVVSAEGFTSPRAVAMVVATIAPARLTGPFNHLGLSSNCEQCHNGVVDLVPGQSKIMGKPGDHFATSNSCQSCHTPQSFASIPFVDHAEVFGECSECHNGVIAVGKSAFHVETNAECDECHNTTHFLELNPDGTFDHSGISRVCASCHNGQVATGKHEGHIVTSAECGFCHTTDTFLGAYPDHTGPEVVGNRCDSCHNNTDASGPTTGHPAITPPVDCDSCHTVAGFSMNGVFDHSLIDSLQQPCESCHNDNNSINAPGKSSSPNPHPDTTSDCGACHNTTNFTEVFDFDHTGRTDNCVECHGKPATGATQASTYPDIGHLPPVQDCSACHVPGTFTSGFLDHATAAEVVGADLIAGNLDDPSCASCHDDVISFGKGVSHLDTTQDCGVCHDTTAFIPASWDHTGISSGCATCHDGDIATGKAPNHVPTTSDCSACHSLVDFTTFAGITYNHIDIDLNNCAVCHDSGIATGKVAHHIPAQAECSLCHISTDSFQSNAIPTFMSAVHSGLTRGCEGCHVSDFFPNNANVYQSAGHIPTAQDCISCHNITSFVPHEFTHDGINGNCESCHDGNYSITAGAVTAEPNDTVHNGISADCSVCHNSTAWAPQDVDHSRPDVLSVRCDSCHNGNFTGIPGKNAITNHVVTSSDCAVCHNTTTFVGGFIDHNSPQVQSVRCDSCHNGTDATGKSAKTNHVPTTSDCGSCHTAGGAFKPSIFDHQGITDNCASCHDGTFATGMSTGHVTIGQNQDCSACHNTTEFAGAHFDHSGITNNCTTCHNGTTAPGKTPPPGHVPTNQDCSVCHQPTGFVPATFDHVGIRDNCRSCHGAGFAIGKPSSHVQTVRDCGVCHNTNTFVGAVFDHSGIVDNCASCHDGNTARGMHNDHIATSLDCHNCHTTATFVGGTWVHDNSTANNCDSCHNNSGGGATGKPNGHLNTTEQCDVCHNTNQWAPTSFRHSSNGDYPGDHRRNPTCQDCHGNTISSNIPWRYSQYAPTCAACHANDYDTGEGDHRGLSRDRNCGESGCHRVSDRNWD